MSRWRPAVTFLVLLVFVLWLRWPSFSHGLWNVDEAIHAAAARILLDGGAMYRDAIDQRSPLTYYAIAGVFAMFGENNLWAARCAVSVLIALTGFLLIPIGRRLGDNTAALTAALLYGGMGSFAFFQGDAYAINTEWFLSFFTTASAAIFLTAGNAPAPRRCVTAGALLGCAFLSKQPALLEIAAPAAFLACAVWREGHRMSWLVRRLAWGAAGWLAVVFFAGMLLVKQGAWADALFYGWSYNLHYYAPETTLGDRLAGLTLPLRLFLNAMPLLVVAWICGGIAVLIHLVQRQPGTTERATHPGWCYLAVWSGVSLLGAASSGRDFQHYGIQFLPAFCLGAGLAADRFIRFSFARTSARLIWRGTAIVVLGTAAWQFVTAAWASRSRSLPEDPSMRVSAYIRSHSDPDDRVFVWGYHPDIYFFSDRRPASRFLYASFLTGLIPWTNVDPGRDTRYAIVPGAMDDLLADLEKFQPQFIVDCSAGPNRHWNKYPPDNFPRFNAYLQTRYRPVATEQFIPQGFRLFQKRSPNDPPAETMAPLPANEMRKLSLAVLSTPLAPISARAPYGTDRTVSAGHVELFAHAPSEITYRLPAKAATVRGGFGIRPEAYGPDNRGPTDGAEFVVRWRSGDSAPVVLLRRLLKPLEQPADRGVQPFQIDIPKSSQGGVLSLEINAGPAGNNASDWTFWSDLVLENSH